MKNHEFEHYTSYKDSNANATSVIIPKKLFLDATMETATLHIIRYNHLKFTIFYISFLNTYF